MGRRYHLLVILVVVAALLAIARLADVAPGIRLALAAAALVWVPGWAMVVLLRPFHDAVLMETLALSFALGCGLLCLEGTIAYAFRCPAGALMLLHLAVVVGLTIAAGRSLSRGAQPESRTPTLKMSLVALGLVLPYIAVGVVWGANRGPVAGGDTWFHLANLAKLIHGSTVSPDCSWFQGVGSDPRYPWSGSHLVGAVVARAAGAQASELWWQLPKVLPLLAFCSLAMLIRRTLGSERLMWAGLVAAAVALPITVAGIGRAVTYPYPMNFLLYATEPVFLALLASYLQTQNRALLVPMGICAWAGACFHVMGVLVPPFLFVVLGVLLVAYPVGKRVRIAYLAAAGVTALAVAPRAIIVLANYAAAATVDADAPRLVVEMGRGLFAVSPGKLTNPWMVVAVAVCLLLAPFLARRPGAAVLCATALVAPFFSANPLTATYLAPWTTPALLSRLYFWPRLYYYAPLLAIAAPAVLALIWDRKALPRAASPPASDSEAAASRGSKARRKEKRRQRRGPRPPASRLLLIGLLPLASLVVCWLWADLANALIFSGFRPTKRMVWIAVGLVVALPRLLALVRCRPDARWWDSMRPVSVGLLIALSTFTGLSMTWRARAEVAKHVGRAEGHLFDTSYPGWEYDERSRLPTFMKPLAELPAGEAVVFCPATWVERMIPGFTGQYVVYGREPGNGKADMAARKAAAEDLKLLGMPRFPSDEALAALRKYQVTHILLNPARARFAGALEEYPGLFRVVDRTLGSALYEVTLTPDALRAARERPDPWRLERRPPSHPQPIGLFAHLALLGVDLDQSVYRPGDAGSVTFYWECVAPTSRDFGVAAHLERPGQRINCDHLLLGGEPIPGGLRAGLILRERCVFFVPPDAVEGQYTVRVGVQDTGTKEWVVPQDARGAVAKQRDRVLMDAGNFFVVGDIGPDLARNGDFQSSDTEDPTLPADWRRRQGTPSTIRLVPRAGSEPGDEALEIRPHPEGAFWQVLTQELPLPERTARYYVSFDARTEGPGKGRASLYLRDIMGKYELLGSRTFSGVAYSRQMFVVDVPARKGTAIELWLGQADYRNTDCTIYYDNVSVRRAE